MWLLRAICQSQRLVRLLSFVAIDSLPVFRCFGL